MSPRIVRSLALTAVVGASFVLASPARAEEPVVRYPPSSIRPKLIAGAVAIEGIAYGAAFLGAEAAPTWPGAQELKIPVVGPWITLGMNACPPNEACDAFLYLRAGLLILDGLLQVAAVAVAVEAIAMKTEAAPAAPAAPARSTSWFTLRPAPFVTPTSSGLGFIGTF